MSRDDDATTPLSESTAPMGASTAPGAADDEELAIGTRVERYVVLDTIGEGGMGTVYAVYDPVLDRKVALKMLQRGRLGHEKRELLVAEAKTLAKLRDPHVLAIHDLAAMDDGRLFMTVDLVDGADAAEWAHEKPRSWRDVRSVFIQAGKGLAAVHRAGIVHRDLKPTNILVDASGHAYVADFGIAISADDGSAPHAGTFAYMAPELEKGGPATPASDQCAFGLAFHELLYGHRVGALPPEGSGRRSVPRFLRTAIARMTAPDPDARFPSMEAAVKAISIEPGRRLVIGALAAAAVAAVGAVIVLSARSPDAPAPCVDDPAALAGTWDPQRRIAVGTSLSATRSDVVDEVLGGLDRYATTWRSSRRDACLATRVRGDQSEEILTLRMACLAGRRSAFDALVAALVQADKRGAKNPIRAVAGLPSIEVCDDTTLLRSQAELPRDHAQQVRIDALEAELDELNAATELSQLPTVDTTARAGVIAERARKLEAHRLVARALMRRGAAEVGTAKIKTLQEAVLEAQAARDYERILKASLSLVIHLCNANRGEETEFTSRLAIASFEAVGRPPALEKDRMWLDGSIGLCQSRTDLSIPAFSRLYELQVNDALSIERGNAASAASNVASAYAYLEQFDKALEWSQKAEAITEKMQPDSNRVLGHLMASWNGLQAGDHAMVERSLDLTVRRMELLENKGGEMRCYVGMTRGLLLLARNDRTGARKHLEDAAACMVPFDASQSIIAQLGVQARTELALADNDPAGLALAKQNIAIMGEDQADARNSVAHALVGRAYIRMKKLDEAAVEIAKAEPFLAKDDHKDERWAMVAFARAELALAQGNAERARTLATEARELRARRKNAFHVAELDALIARASR